MNLNGQEKPSFFGDVFPEETMDTILSNIVSDIIRIHSENNLTAVPLQAVAVTATASKGPVGSIQYKFDMLPFKLKETEGGDADIDWASEYLVSKAPVLNSQPVAVAVWSIQITKFAQADQNSPEITEEMERNAQSCILITGTALNDKKNAAIIEIRRDEDGVIRIENQGVVIMKVSDNKPIFGGDVVISDRLMKAYLVGLAGKQKGAT